MHLFSRTVVVNAVTPETLGLASDLRAHVSDTTGIDIGLWAAGFGAPYGSMTYAGPVDGLTGVMAINQALAADETYQATAAELRQHAAGLTESQLMEPIHGEVRADGSPPIGAIATVTTAVADAPYDQVVQFGVEIAQLGESIMGTPIVFGTAMAGTFGEFAWIAVSADAAAADEANAKLIANADYIAKISAATDLFVSGASHRVISTRVA